MSIKLSENDENISEFLEKCKEAKAAEADIAKAEKLGIDTNIKVVHPLTDKKIPVWIGNFVLLDYGTGVVMGVPGHDTRDHEFASKYGLEINQVIETDSTELPIIDKGVLVNSGKFDGMSSEEASQKIIKELIELDKGKELIQFRLRDWGVSRQRYWGCPIPVIYEESLPKMVNDKDIPVELPKLARNSLPTPLNQNDDFRRYSKIYNCF